MCLFSEKKKPRVSQIIDIFNALKATRSELYLKF